MRAAVYKRYGEPEVVQIREVDKPEPGEEEILVRVMATTVTAVDSIFRKGEELFPRLATGLFRPKAATLGTEFCGIVESVGEKVSGFAPGDAVLADSGTHYGAHAEYVTLSGTDPMVRKPENLSFEEAAAVPYGALTALPFLRDHGKVGPGMQVLILGASGAVGTYAVQLARHFGAEVTGVCSAENAELVASLGASRVIDYRKQKLEELTDRFDVIFDTVGKYTFPQCRPLLTESGVYMTTVLGMPILRQMARTWRSKGKRAILSLTGLRSPEDRSADLAFVRELLEEGAVRPVVDRVFALEEIVEAYRYVDSGRKKGNVVIRVGEVTGLSGDGVGNSATRDRNQPEADHG